MMKLDKDALLPDLVGIAEEIGWFAPVRLHDRTLERLRALEGPGSDAVRAATADEELYGELVMHHEAVLDVLHGRSPSTRPARRAVDRNAVVERLVRLRSMLLAHVDATAAVGAALQQRIVEWSDLGVHEYANGPLTEDVRETARRNESAVESHRRLEAAVLYVESQGDFPPRELRPSRVKRF